SRKDAWFETNGTWLMTETDIRRSKIPAAVKSTLDKSEYAGWRIDDVDCLEYANADPVYVLDMEKGESEVDLYYAADGTLKETKQDSYLKYHMP
ncbi:MAG: PepSY-like domain-containing protein, partial [Paludibacter sp.]|nr:PepSY-like domain-containing protein [Paludibacter sp.]